jgi:DNA repair exonuclease SbcCD nuclease subunit
LQKTQAWLQALLNSIKAFFGNLVITLYKMTTLRYIFHLSDLHIRNGDKISCRYDEYNDVFNETVISISNEIKKLNLLLNEFIIIISGDIFHNKNIIGNYGLLLYKNFIEQLVKLGRVIIFHGNHDRNQSEIEQPSLVFSSTFNIDNLTLLAFDFELVQ